MSNFVGFPKIKRYYAATATLTEKIDGTNACIFFDDEGHMECQSRKRIITPDDDNFGFAAWAHENAAELFAFFGPGRHFGEWHGQGIQRGYGMTERHFSPFNTHRFNTALDVPWPECVTPVPVLSTVALSCLAEGLSVWTRILRRRTRVVGAVGSIPSEGIMIYTDLGYFKAPFDPLPKGAVDD